MSEHSTRLTHTLPGELAVAVRAALDDWRQNKKVARLWARDASLWTGADEARWLGWLELTRTTETECRELTAFAEEIRSEGFTRALVLGMGGSSMARMPWTLRRNPNQALPRPSPHGLFCFAAPQGHARNSCTPVLE